MAFVVVLEKSPIDGRISALIHRRSRHIRYPHRWGFPGGSADKEERNIISNFSYLQEKILRRVAVREFIEETGGGSCPNCSSQCIRLPAVPECNLREQVFEGVLVPPGVLRMLYDETVFRSLQIPGSTTMIYFYFLDPSIDYNYINNNWKPRAMKRFRGEIDEDYSKPNCFYGYTRVDLERLVSLPNQPYEFSQKPLCPFLTKTFSSLSGHIFSLIHEHEISRFGMQRTSSVPAIVPSYSPSISVLQGCYFRLRLETFLEQQMNEITYRLEETFKGEFVSQLNAAARLGCRPLHLPLYCAEISSSDKCERLCERILPIIATRYAVVTADLTLPTSHSLMSGEDIISISTAGHVRLHLGSCPGYPAIQREISRQLAGSIDSHL